MPHRVRSAGARAAAARRPRPRSELCAPSPARAAMAARGGGKRKLTPFERQKAEAEAKRRRNEEENAAFMSEFLDNYEKEQQAGVGAMGFVRGGTVQAGKEVSGGVAKAPRGELYVPQQQQRQQQQQQARQQPQQRTPQAFAGFPTDADEEREEPPSMPAAKNKKRRAMDDFLEELKQREVERQHVGGAAAVAAVMPQASAVTSGDAARDGSHHDGASLTTNLFFGHLDPFVDERMLGMACAAYGDVASVKVMWPRSEEERRRGWNSGFVAFMTVEGARDAMRALVGTRIGGGHQAVRIDWGKPVALPAVPKFRQADAVAVERTTKTKPLAGGAGTIPQPAGAQQDAGRGKADGTSQGAEHVVSAGAVQSAVAGASDGNDAAGDAGAGASGGVDAITVHRPVDERVLQIIDALASFVAVDGGNFEVEVMAREAANPLFAFLFDEDSPEHAYYKWRVYSLAAGDHALRWKADPFVMVEGGAKWEPPPLLVSDATANAAENEQRGADSAVFGESAVAAAAHIRSMLREVTLERSSVCEVMTAALDASAHAAFVAAVLVEAVSGRVLRHEPKGGDGNDVDDDSLRADRALSGIVGMYACSDVLANARREAATSSAQDAYRTELCKRLPVAVCELGKNIAESGLGRVATEQLRQRALRVLVEWSAWFLFSSDRLTEMENALKAPARTVLA